MRRSSRRTSAARTRGCSARRSGNRPSRQPAFDRPRRAPGATTVACCADPLRPLPRQSRLLSDELAARTLIYKRKSLPSVLKDLGKRGITSVLIEGGGEVLGEALDKRLIDKVQIYLGPILTGGPVVAFPGEGVEKTADALRLRDIEYEQIGQTVSLRGYPDVRITRKLSTDLPVKLSRR